MFTIYITRTPILQIYVLRWQPSWEISRLRWTNPPMYKILVKEQIDQRLLQHRQSKKAMEKLRLIEDTDAESVGEGGGDN